MDPSSQLRPGLINSPTTGCVLSAPLFIADRRGPEVRANDASDMTRPESEDDCGGEAIISGGGGGGREVRIFGDTPY